MLKWSNGNQHIGLWKNGKINGHGTFTWADGREYVGDFKNDNRCGQGTLIWPDETNEKRFH